MIMTYLRNRMSRARRTPLLSTLLLALLCVPATARAQFPPDSFTNLKLLPRDITAFELIGIMGGFTRALGVRCTHCHVGAEDIPLDQYDFASDDKLAKRKARTMIEMVGRINDVHLAGLEDRAAPPIRVECFTCHRGTLEPRTLQSRVAAAYQAAGIDSAIAAYEALRQRFYGRAIYDFSEVALAEVAAGIAAANRLADAERLHELNVRTNPESDFARLQYVSVALNHAFSAEGVAGGVSRHTELRDRFGGTPFPEPLLNTLGYSLLRRQRMAEAVAVLRINAATYPRSSNVHDSLGEALAASGDVPEAIRSYERAVELDPANANAIARLRALRSGGR